MNIIKSKIGQEVENEVLNEEISKNIAEIGEKEKLQSLIQPEIEFKDNYNFSLSYFLRPELKIDDLKDSEIENITAEVKDKDIDEFREKVRKEYYSLESIEESDENSVIDFEVTNFEEEQKKSSQKDVRIDLNTQTKEQTLDLKKALVKIKNKSDFSITTKEVQIDGKIKDINKKDLSKK